jgi:hypothetical protein
MPKLNHKRSTAGSFITNNKNFIYIFNGYEQINFEKTIVKSVERLNLKNMSHWDIILF